MKQEEEKAEPVEAEPVEAEVVQNPHPPHLPRVLLFPLAMQL